MSSGRQVTMRDLTEEAKKRIVVLAICVVGLSYLMSLTSSSVWVNLPAAAVLIIALRYVLLDFEMKRKASAYNNRKATIKKGSSENTLEVPKIVRRANWRRKVDSPIIEDAMEQFTRHLISEWVTDLWYHKLTPDREGPEELVHIIIDVLAEISDRARNVNLIDLLTRDVVSLVCTHLEVFRYSQAKIEKQAATQLSTERLDCELRKFLAFENKLHPALFSAEAEHKVLQHVMEGLILFTFKTEDLQCSFFRYIVRELLACALMRPVINLANPRFINERIELFIISRNKSSRNSGTGQGASPSKNVSSGASVDQFSRYVDPSVTGVELVQLKMNPPKSASETTADKVGTDANLLKDPLLSLDTRSSRSWNSLPGDTANDDHRGLQHHRSAGEWGEMLDVMSRRKAQALAPEHFDNMWTKGRNYRQREGDNRVSEPVPQVNSIQKAVARNDQSSLSNPKKGKPLNGTNLLVSTSSNSRENSYIQVNQSFPGGNQLSDITEDDELNHMILEEVDSPSSSYTSEDEDATTVTGIGSPGKRVWDGKSKRNMALSHIHHPLESSEVNKNARKTSRHLLYQSFSSNQSNRKRSRLNSKKVHVWQEVERTSFLSGDGQDLLNASRNGDDVSSGDSDDGTLRGTDSGTAVTSPTTSESKPESSVRNAKSLLSSLAMDSFMKLRCEVLGANIVKSGSKTFAVYSISVTDINNHCWSIKRRFRHFEELHRRLKEFPEYNLHLPPKHFLSAGLDVSVIKERCKLLDKYLKSLMQLQRVSGSIEVWDFLSVDSQTYYFSNSFSIIETLSVSLDDKPSSERNQRVSGGTGSVMSPSPVERENSLPYIESAIRLRRDTGATLAKNTNERTVNSSVNNASEEISNVLLDAGSDPSLPSEWVPPNLSIPLLDLVEVVFQVQDGGWIRRKAFWVAKQVLHLGMGDAFDDWLIDKILLLRKGSVIASGIKRVEQILWPDGIFITKHPKRQQPPQTANSPKSGPPTPQISTPLLTAEQQLEAERRAKFVYEIMIDKAPAAVVGLVGRKEYEQSAKDLYLFLQSTVCLKLLVFDLLELLLLSLFPEMDNVFKQLHEEKHQFGEFKP
ncbi:hypothetical protein MLD38_004885 [Melastoma candidum]|uniref:Uncharacterized protein n=1 Tax=Melastoma candidum TaxID=119954 RepID=A0ACB9SC09_9MYRT|nr:hypothetical protein MLD38_004885 [Melastoma candidum]